jgi:hypothetical protein
MCLAARFQTRGHVLCASAMAIVSALTFASVAAADVSPFRKLSAAELDQAIDLVVARGTQPALTKAAALALASSQALVVSVAPASTPGCRHAVTLLNASQRAMWNLTVVANATNWSRSTTVHVPVLPAQSATIVRLGCVYAYRDAPAISLPSGVPGPVLSEDLARQMAAADSDLVSEEGGFRESLSRTSRALDALRILGPEPALVGELGSSLLRIDNGGEALGEYVAANPGGLAKLDTSSMSSAPPQTATALLSSMLNRPEARAPRALSLVSSACGAWKGPTALELWFRALGDDTPSDPLRDEILRACRPSEQQIVDKLSTLDDSAQAAGLEQLQLPTLSALLKRKPTKSLRRVSLLLLAQRTRDTAKLQELSLAFAGNDDSVGLALSLAQAADNVALTEKQDLLRSIVAKKEGTERRALLVSLVELGAQVTSPTTRRLIAKQALEDAATAERLTDMLASSSKVFAPQEILERSLAGTFDLLGFWSFNAAHLDSCHSNLDSLRECVHAVQTQGAAFKGTLNEQFAASARELLQADEASLALAPTVSRGLGLDLEPVVLAVCDREVERAATPSKASETNLSALDNIAPANDCRARVGAVVFKQLLRDTGVIALAIALLVVPGVVLFRVYRKSWLRLKPALSTAAEEVKHAQGGVISTALNDAAWSRGFDGALRKAREDLLAENDGLPNGAVRAVDAILASATLRERARASAIEGLGSGEVKSFLARCAGVLAYILIFPTRHEDPKGLRRYAPFRRGWVEHSRELRRRLAAQQEPNLPILSVLVFVGANGTDGSLLVGYDDERTSLLPGAVVEEAEGRASGGRRIESQRLLLERAFG